MLEYNVYEDIAQRSGGDIYVGVVGPVRTGKSTLIKKFMTELFPTSRTATLKPLWLTNCRNRVRAKA